MSIINWPNSLPNPISGSWNATSVSPYVKDKPEFGASLKRRRFTRSLKLFKFSLQINRTQLADIWNFYEAICSDGGESFNWIHPITDHEYECRFATELKESNVEADLWSVDIELEEI